MGHSIAPSRRRRGRLLAALVISVGVVAAACGGSDNKSSQTTAAPGNTDGTGVATTAAPPTTAAEEKPIPGGKLVMAVEADTSNPWRPSEMLCAISCHQIIRNIFDTLTMPNEDGSWSPYLAESVTPNADFTVWKIKARAGVTFHDGTPFDGAAIVENLSRDKAGITTGAILRSVKTVAVDPADPMTAVVTVEKPWAAFPFALMGQAGYQASPTWLKASDTDASLKTKPVGTGPFVYDSYVPNEVFSMKKNTKYWNAPYPFLDAVEFRPISDGLSRRDALLSGTVDMLHTANGQNIAAARTDTAHKLTEITNNGETSYTLLHVTQDGSPLTDVNVRCALAYASDEQALIDSVGAGVGKQADGPFSPTQVGYLADSGYPMKQDMAKAKELIAAYKAAHPGKLTLSLATTQDQTNLVTAQQQQQWWQEAGFDEVTIDQIDQAQYILTAVLGNFQVFQWRNHGGFDLDQQYYWWHSSSAPPVGQLALNFGRIRDTQLDTLLDDNRASNDPAKKKQIAEDVNKLFGKQCYNIWGSWTVWGILSQPKVHGPVVFALPDGKKAAFGAGIAGTFYMMDIWVDK